MRPKDLTFVLHFDVEVELLQDFTADLRLLDKAIEETEINGGGVRPREPFPPAIRVGRRTFMMPSTCRRANCSRMKWAARFSSC